MPDEYNELPPASAEPRIASMTLGGMEPRGYTRPGYRRRHDVLAGGQDSAQVADRLLHPVRRRGGVDNTVRIATEDLRCVLGGAHADRADAGEFAGILAVFVVRVHPYPDQVEVGSVGDGADRVLPDSAGGPDGDLIAGIHDFDFLSQWELFTASRALVT